MKPLWTRYVDKIDQSILEALRVNVKSSMENILLQLRKPTMISMGLEESRVSDPAPGSTTDAGSRGYARAVGARAHT